MPTSRDWTHPTPWADVKVHGEPLPIMSALRTECPSGHRVGGSGGWYHCDDCKAAWPVNEYVYEAAMQRAAASRERQGDGN